MNLQEKENRVNQENADGHACSKHWDEGYTCVGNSFWLDENLNPSQLRIWGILLTFHYCDEKPIAIDYLIKLSGLKKNTVINAIKKLLELEYIEETKKATAHTCRFIRILYKYSVSLQKRPQTQKINLYEFEKQTSVGLKSKHLRVEKTVPNKVTKKRNNKRKEKKSSSDKSERPVSEKDIVQEKIENIIGHLNLKTKRKYSANTKDTQKLLRARLRDIDDVTMFHAVIDRKCSQWLESSNMSRYLRPATLFNEKNFDAYRNESDPITQKQREDEHDAKLLAICREGQFNFVNGKLKKFNEELQAHNLSDKKRAEIKAGLAIANKQMERHNRGEFL